MIPHSSNPHPNIVLFMGACTEVTHVFVECNCKIHITQFHNPVAREGSNCYRIIGWRPWRIVAWDWLSAFSIWSSFNGKGCCPWYELVSIKQQISNTNLIRITRLHSVNPSIIHRDLKTANLLVCKILLLSEWFKNLLFCFFSIKRLVILTR